MFDQTVLLKSKWPQRYLNFSEKFLNKHIPNYLTWMCGIFNGQVSSDVLTLNWCCTMWPKSVQAKLGEISTRLMQSFPLYWSLGWTFNVFCCPGIQNPKMPQTVLFQLFSSLTISLAMLGTCIIQFKCIRSSPSLIPTPATDTIGCLMICDTWE